MRLKLVKYQSSNEQHKELIRRVMPKRKREHFENEQLHETVACVLSLSAMTITAQEVAPPKTYPTDIFKPHRVTGTKLNCLH